MRLVNIDLNVNFEIEENKVYEIVIEDPRCFASTIGMLMEQTQGGDGNFILSDKNKEIKIDKRVELIVDYYSLSVNNRRMIGKLYSALESVAQEHVEEKSAINEKMVNLLDEIAIGMGYNELRYELDFKWTDIFKLYDVGFSDSYTGLYEKLLNYLKVISELTDICLVF